MSKLEEFTALLRNMFQFDRADLDFGFYRVMAQKKAEVEKFIRDELPEQIRRRRGELAAVSPELADIERKIEEMRANSALSESVRGAALAELEAKKHALDLPAPADVEAEIYSRLIEFFSRYYEDGDFISQRRYRDGTYAIPYDGEEVKLHWANADQYYVKSEENFTDYAFRLPDGARVKFKLVDADVLKDNVRDSDAVRCFTLWDPAETAVVAEETEADDAASDGDDAVPALPDKILEEKDGELVIYFLYAKFKGTKNLQKQLCESAAARIRAELALVPALLQKYSGLETPAPTEKASGRKILDRELTRYTAKNTSDYFIHKNLGGFLSRELDNYIKSDVVFIDDIETQDEAKTRSYIVKAKVIRGIAKKIIAFLAQLEDFQKSLWLKKKFVVQCDYCLTLDRVPAEMLDEVLANAAQKAEWEKLGFPPFPEDVPANELTLDSRMADTKFFPPSFKEKLLASIDDLDEHCDGVLVRSENFQALNLLRERYRGQVKCIYIDPPYNTGNDGFVYKDRYQHSSWLSMMEERLRLARERLGESGVIFISIDNVEQANVKLLCDQVFGEENFIECFLWNKTSTPPALSYKSRRTHEYILCYQKKRDNSRFVGLVNSGGDAPLLNESNREAVLNFPGGRVESNLSDGIYSKGFKERVELLDDVLIENGIIKNPFSLKGKFRWGQETLDSELRDGCRLIVKSEKFAIRYCRLGERTVAPPNLITERFFRKNNIVDKVSSGVDTNDAAGEELRNIFGASFFSFPKPTSLISYLISFNGNSTSEILDFFAGSGTTGHAVINLNREDGGRRKYILVEMGEHFETVLKPRIEKVVYSPNWKNGEPQNSDKGVSHCFKYMTLESYEDALNNIELRAEGELPLAVREGYFLNYMLGREAQGSACLLNLDALEHPFDYMMNIRLGLETNPVRVDLVETFNWLVGLRVYSVSETRMFAASFVRGEHGALAAALRPPSDESVEDRFRFKHLTGLQRDGGNVLVVWRELSGDAEKDNAALTAYFRKLNFESSAGEFSKIYVNGDNNLRNLHDTWKIVLIEDEMKRRLFEND